MGQAIEKLHDLFCKPVFDTLEHQRIERNHQHLINVLNKKQRRKVLRIINDMDWLRYQSSLSSFTAGLQLGMALARELQKENGHLFGEFAEEDGRF